MGDFSLTKIYRRSSTFSGAGFIYIPENYSRRPDSIFHRSNNDLIFSPYVVWALVPAVSAALVNAVFAFW